MLAILFYLLFIYILNPLVIPIEKVLENKG